MDWVVYEQMPWDRVQVSRLYSGIADIQADGQWHSIPSRFRYCRYRVFDSATFSVVCGNRAGPLLREVLRADAPNSSEDAEWLLVRFGAERYAIASKFTRTFGPFLAIDSVNEWLEPCGLGLNELDHEIRGFSYFTSLEPGCWLDAMERLRVLETMCLDTNRRANETIANSWSAYEDQFREASHGVADEEIATPPGSILRSGPKHREPIPKSLLDGGKGVE